MKDMGITPLSEDDGEADRLERVATLNAVLTAAHRRSRLVQMSELREPHSL